MAADAGRGGAKDTVAYFPSPKAAARAKSGRTTFHTDRDTGHVTQITITVAIRTMTNEGHGAIPQIRKRDSSTAKYRSVHLVNIVGANRNRHPLRY
jgi:hypothetical protein